MRERKFNQIDATIVQQNNVNLTTMVSSTVATLASTDTLVSAALSTEISTRVSTDATHLVATKLANQTISIAEDVAGLKTDFNALLLKLKNAGIMLGD